ncbi:UDP-N-acetyl glucosamine 2-epimerase [Marinobacter confluentis]|uniref:UDP-N-acetyl glucosamine 2-epimerase n=1 Tax=Marinobacter confluentis TaxID=1697557 RepID=A0A4Z1C3K1_9GAMM|nr:UDP-N-acetyl glucosamine 2-epimerase [Marinobacter confluentis]TGN39920.1 hypothetical protein E5Q11_06370 [Marinobacter confluentis]
MKHLLMVCYGGGHMKVLAPLYGPLSSRYRISMLALTSAGAFMREQGIPSLGFSDFAFCHAPEIQAHGRRLAENMTSNGTVSREETVAYMGASFFDLVNQSGDEEAAAEQYQRKGRAAFLPVASLRKVIAELGIDAVVTTNAPRAERAALVAAKEAGLPAVCINDNLWIRGGVADVAADGLADRICVLSEQVRQALIAECAVNPGKVVVTGTPVFDALKNVSWVPGKDVVPRVLLADCDLPDVHPYLDLHNANPGIAEAVRSELNRLAEDGVIDVYFRPHPSQRFDYSAYPAIKLSMPEESLHERLARTDVVVTAISTVGVEGKVMGLGLVSLENTVFSTIQSYGRLGLSSGIEEACELESAILREHQKVQKREPEQMYEGVAVENIVAVIDALFTGQTFE